MSYNIVTAMQGRLGSDPELRTAKSGKRYVRFNLAVGEGDNIQWVQVSAFDTCADKVVAALKKGCRAYVEGRLKLDA